MRDCADGSARRTVKPSPRSAVRGTTTAFSASHWNLSPAFGSWPGKKLMMPSVHGPIAADARLNSRSQWAFNLDAF